MYCIYNPHYWPDRVEGHLYFEVPEGEPCTITLTPAASATQEWLNEKGDEIARAMNDPHRT